MAYISDEKTAGSSYLKTSTLRDRMPKQDSSRTGIAGIAAASGTAALYGAYYTGASNASTKAALLHAAGSQKEVAAKATASVAEHLIRGGLMLSAATLGTSLFLYAHPGYTMQDFRSDASSAIEETLEHETEAAYGTRDAAKAATQLAMNSVSNTLQSAGTAVENTVHDFKRDVLGIEEPETMLAENGEANGNDLTANGFDGVTDLNGDGIVDNLDAAMYEGQQLAASGMSREEALDLLQSNDALKVFKDEGEMSYEDMISKIEMANRHAGIYDEAETAEDILAEFASAGAETDTDLILSTAMGPMLYYSQDDSHWKDFAYGGVDPLSGYGCGPTVCSMLINSFGNLSEGESISPVDIAEWAADNKQYALHSGSMHTLIPKALAAYGLNATAVPEDRWTPADLSVMLKEGHVLVALVGPGTFTNGGHFLILTEESTGGKIRIADSNNLNFTLEDWDPQTIIDELNWTDASGAPLWMISRS